MASSAEVDFLDSLVNYLKARREAGELAGAPEDVVSKGGRPLKLYFLKESEIEPKYRPCVTFVVEGVDLPHPKLAKLVVSMECDYSVDDFDEAEVSGWQRAVADLLSDSQLAGAGLAEQMGVDAKDWVFRKIVPGGGGSEVAEKRSRDLRDQWSVHLMRRCK